MPLVYSLVAPLTGEEGGRQEAGKQGSQAQCWPLLCTAGSVLALQAFFPGLKPTQIDCATSHALFEA